MRYFRFTANPACATVLLLSMISADLGCLESVRQCRRCAATFLAYPGTLPWHRFDFVKNLEAGALGFVQLYFNAETDEEVAIKFLKRSAVNRYMEVRNTLS